MRSIERPTEMFEAEVPVQEVVVIALPKTWLRKTCPGVNFLIAANLKKNFGYVCIAEETENIPAGRKDHFKWNMIDLYKDHPDERFAIGKYQTVDEVCYAKFLSNRYKDIKNKQSNDTKPRVPDERGNRSFIDDSVNDKILPKSYLSLILKEY